MRKVGEKLEKSWRKVGEMCEEGQDGRKVGENLNTSKRKVGGKTEKNGRKLKEK